MGWPFGKNKRPAPESILGRRMPADEERLGPAPAPPRTAHAPRVSVHPFGAAEGLAVLAERSPARPGRTLVLRAGGGERPELAGGAGLELAALALSRARITTGASESALDAGDLLFTAAGAGLSLAPDDDAALLLDVASGRETGSAHVRRDALTGRPFAGVTGIRAMRRTPHSLAVRLGPPPGARWVLVGLRSFAVFFGRFSVVDGDEALDVRAGELAVIADPTATLYLSAGNDAALAVGFAAPDLVVALG